MTTTPHAWLGTFELIEDRETPQYHTANFAMWASSRDEINQIVSELEFEKPWGIHRVVTALPASEWPTPNTETQELAQGVSAQRDFQMGGTYPLAVPPIDVDDGTEYLTITEHEIPPLPEQKGIPFWDKEWIVPELKELLFGQPDPEQRLNTYFVVDATLRKNITKVFDLDVLDVPVKCLFTGEAAEELEEVAPYLIDMTLSDDILNDKEKLAPRFHRDFFENHWDKGTGIAIRTTASMDELHHHLRKFTKYQNEEGKSFFFRFWETNCTFDYFSQLGTTPERAKKIFLLTKQHWITHLVSYSEKMGRLHTVEPSKELLASTAVPPKTFDLTTTEERALLKSVLRPYALMIKQNTLTQYPGYFPDTLIENMEDRVLNIIMVMQQYGFFRLEYLQRLVESALFFGDDFIEQDRTGTLLSILSSKDEEEQKFQRFIDYWPRHEERLLKNNENYI